MIQNNTINLHIGHFFFIGHSLTTKINIDLKESIAVYRKSILLDKQHLPQNY